MGSVVAEFLAENNPVPIKFIGIHDQFGQSGTQDELFKHYKLTAQDILNKVREF
jgi:transketolase